MGLLAGYEPIVVLLVVLGLYSAEVGSVAPGMEWVVPMGAALAIFAAAWKGASDRIMSVVQSPYYYSGSVVARASVLSASTVWALLVLSNDNALRVTAYGHLVTVYIHENYLAGAVLAVCVTMLYRLWRKYPPHWSGGFVYALLFCGWVFLAMLLWFSTRPMQPTLTGWATVGAALSAYALISGQKYESPAEPGPIVRWLRVLCRYCGLAKDCKNAIQR